MKVKQFLFSALILLCIQSLSAQYKVDKINAPANPIPIQHTKEHFNLKGDIKSDKTTGTWSFEYIFDNKGNLIFDRSDLLGDLEYIYDSSGKLVKTILKEGKGETAEIYTCDSQKRITQWQSGDGRNGTKYFYNNKGLWVESQNLSGQVTHKKYYDSKDRIVKEEIFSEGKMTYINDYVYANSGNYLVITKNGRSLTDGKTSSYTDYYLNGVNLYSSSTTTLNYDKKGNWYEWVNNGYVTSTRILTYHDGTTSGKSTIATPSTPSNPLTPSNPSVPTPGTPTTTNDCVSGDCVNGWGKKNFSYGYYEGFWKNGKRHGYGFFRWTGSGDYMGFWENDDLHGYGCYLGTKKNMTGEYKNGMLNGVAYTHDLENEKWEYGIFKNYLMDTPYTFYDNKIATGCIAGDCQNTYGRYKWSNGDVFTGFFRNGKMYMGTYNFASGDKYEGMFNSNNQYHGQGRFFFKDKSYYGGEWVNGLQEGKGYFHDSNYNKKIGEWSKGQLVRSYQ
ncbi:MAG: hypothetical protein R2776_06440 [Flavobacteriaceae bacterium]|nr:hypothetical protein [Flavobacteriaceae bacterium]